MANYAEALSAGPKPRSKPPKKELEVIKLRKAENGGAVAEHTFTDYAHKPETHVFGAEEGHKLAAHLTKHLGMQIPGNAADGAQNEEESGAEDEES